jgi:hypothetical protein
VHRDLQLAAAGLVDLVGELLDVHGVEVVGRVGGRQVPLGLGLGGNRQRGDGGNSPIILPENVLAS